MKKLLLKKRKILKTMKFNVKFVFITYYVIIKKKRKQFQCYIYKKDFFSNNLLYAYIKIKFYF